MDYFCCKSIHYKLGNIHQFFVQNSKHMYYFNLYKTINHSTVKLLNKISQHSDFSEKPNCMDTVDWLPEYVLFEKFH